MPAGLQLSASAQSELTAPVHVDLLMTFSPKDWRFTANHARNGRPRLASCLWSVYSVIGSRAVAPGGARYSMPQFFGRAVFRDSRGSPQGAKL